MATASPALGEAHRLHDQVAFPWVGADRYLSQDGPAEPERQPLENWAGARPNPAVPESLEPQNRASDEWGAVPPLPVRRDPCPDAMGG
jgi:hypothetical protein